MFSGSRNSNMLIWMSPYLTGSRKSKMAAVKLEKHKSQIVHDIIKKFQRLHLHFWGPAFEWSYGKPCWMQPEARIPIWRPSNRKYLEYDKTENNALAFIAILHPSRYSSCQCHCHMDIDSSANRWRPTFTSTRSTSATSDWIRRKSS